MAFVALETGLKFNDFFQGDLGDPAPRRVDGKWFPSGTLSAGPP